MYQTHSVKRAALSQAHSFKYANVSQVQFTKHVTLSQVHSTPSMLHLATQISAHLTPLSIFTKTVIVQLKHVFPLRVIPFHAQPTVALHTSHALFVKMSGVKRVWNWKYKRLIASKRFFFRPAPSGNPVQPINRKLRALRGSFKMNNVRFYWPLTISLCCILSQP